MDKKWKGTYLFVPYSVCSANLTSGTRPSQTQSAGESGKVSRHTEWPPLQSGVPGRWDTQGKRNRRGSRASPSSICLPVSFLHSHHDLIQSFPCEVGHHGVFTGVPHREQHQELFIGGAVQKHSQTGATVERRGGDSHQSSILLWSLISS